MGRMRLVSVVLPAEFLDALEDLVRSGRFPNRSAAIREAVRRLLEEERLLASGGSQP